MKTRRIQKQLLSLLLAAVLCMCCVQTDIFAMSRKRSRTPGTVTVQAPDGTIRTYLHYRQNRNYKNGRFSSVGAKFYCVLTATAIAASGFGMRVSPTEILDADASVPYSERYALAQLHLMRHKRQAHTLYLSAQILRDMGIPVKYVPVYQADTAEREISAHLAAGKPVIVLTKRGSWNNIQIAQWRHAIVLVQLNSDGTVTYINPNASVNGTAHRGKRKNVHLTVRQLLDHFMFSSSGTYAKAYNPRNCGGYILVG